MTRWMRPPELDRARGRERFDPIVEGVRLGLSRELASTLWQRVRADATDGAGRCDLDEAERRFRELAAVVAARGGRLSPDVGRLTRAGLESAEDLPEDWRVELLIPRAPGRETLVAAEARRRRIRSGLVPAPGRDTEATAAPEESSSTAARAGRGTEATAAAERPRAGEAARATAAWHLPSPEGPRAGEAARATAAWHLRSPAGPARPASSAARVPVPRWLDLRAWGPPTRESLPDAMRFPAAAGAPARSPQPMRRSDADPPVRSLADADRATQVREAARLYQDGELGAALARGEPGLVGAVAAALRDGAILAPHPVDQWRHSVRGLAADLTTVGVGLGRSASRWLGTTPLAPAGQRAFEVADAWTGGAARAWSERARGWAGGVARRAMAYQDRSSARGAGDELARLSTAGGAPLSPELRARMEAVFGHRFGHVRIHTDDAGARAAAAAGARAVTLGSHIYFSRGEFAPGSEAGDRLLLHELTHVVQHDRGQLPDPASGRVELSSPSDPAEREARAMESRVGSLHATAPAAGAARDAGASPAGHAASHATTFVVREGVAPASGPSASAARDSGPSASAAPVSGPSTSAARDSGPSASAARDSGPSASAAPASGLRPSATLASGPSAGAAASGPSTGDTPRAGKRASANPFGDFVDWAGDKIQDVENWAEDKIEGLVLKVAPGLGTLIHEGPGGLIKNAIEPAVSSWVGTVTGGVDVGKLAGQLKGSFSSAFAVLQGARAGDPKCCETLVNGINAIRELAHSFMNNPVMDAIKGVLTKVSSIVETVTKVVIGPVFDVLKSIIGGAWDAIKGVASTIQKWFDAVKHIASKAFDWVAKKLGFPSGGGEGGLLDWLKQKAIEVWDKIKQTLKPVMGPLKVIGGILLLLTPLPEIYAIIKYGPQIVEAVQWLWANRNNPDAVKQNPKLLGGSILPKILGAGQSFVGMVKKGVAWLVDKITAFAGGALELAGAITGIPLLGMAKGFVQTLTDGIKGVQEWATNAFTSAEHWLEDLFHKVSDFIKPYADVLCSVAVAIVNPSAIPAILAGWAWRWLPDCIKPPLIDLLLDAVIGFLSHMPSLPMLGPLWPLLKAGVLGFLRELRGKDPKTKITISNKLAKIISGSSPAFLLGFVKGLLRGVWDGIKMPFEAIWMILKGIGKAGEFFTALFHASDAKAGPQTPAAAAGKTTPATQTAAPPSRTAHALPAVPGEIHPDEASAVVGRITAQLNAQRPPRPAVPPGTPPGGTATASHATAGGNAQGDQYRALGQEAQHMASDLAGPSKTVATDFGPAVHQLFSGGAGGKGMSIDDLMSKLHSLWEAAKAAVAKQGAKIADMICEFFLQDSAEEKLGDTIGYLVGMIAFQALVDAFSGGAWSEVSVVLTTIAKFLNWPMEFLGKAMEALKLLGGYLLDGLKSLGKMVEEGAGPLRSVTGALRDIAGKLREFADEIMGKFGKDIGKDADGATARTAEDDAANAAKRDPKGGKDEPHGGKDEPNSNGYKNEAEREAEKAAEFGEAVAIAKGIARSEDAGHVPGPGIATSLEVLKSRYRWIKAFTARPTGRHFEIHLIASDENVYTTKNDDEPGTPHGDPKAPPRNEPEVPPGKEPESPPPSDKKPGKTEPDGTDPDRPAPERDEPTGDGETDSEPGSSRKKTYKATDDAGNPIDPKEGLSKPQIDDFRARIDAARGDIDAQMDIRYERYRQKVANRTPHEEPWDRATWEKNNPQLRESVQRGIQIEDEAVSAVGVAQSNNAAGQYLQHPFHDSATGRDVLTRPDGFVGNDVVESKYIAPGSADQVLYDSPQLRAQRDLAEKLGGDHRLVISSENGERLGFEPPEPRPSGPVAANSKVEFYDPSQHRITHRWDAVDGRWNAVE